MKRGDVVNFYPELTRRGVSATMQRKVGTTLTIGLNKAVDQDLLPSNPATKVEKPRARKPEVMPFDADQAAAFLFAARSKRAGLPVCEPKKGKKRKNVSATAPAEGEAKT